MCLDCSIVEAVPPYSICHGGRRGQSRGGHLFELWDLGKSEKNLKKIWNIQKWIFFASKDGCAGLVRQSLRSRSKNSLPNLGCGGLCTRPASPAGMKAGQMWQLFLRGFQCLPHAWGPATTVITCDIILFTWKREAKKIHNTTIVTGGFVFTALWMKPTLIVSLQCVDLSL